MAISIDFINISSWFLGKQINNSDQGARIRWPTVPGQRGPLCPCGQVENKCD